MKRTTNLKLQKPDASDVYNSDTITQNYRTIDRYLANLGGNVPYKLISNPAQFITVRDADFEITGGSLAILGNGLAYIEVTCTNKKEITVNQYGLMSGPTTIGDVLPEYATAISQPLSSGMGMAIGGYIAPDNTRVVLRQLKGYLSTGKIGVGTSMQLGGIYPLAVVPIGIGLEQMPSNSFDTFVHERNLLKMDGTAQKLQTKLPAKAYTQAEAIAGIAPFSIQSFIFQRNSNGMMNLEFRIRSSSGITNTTSGDIYNTQIATLLLADTIPKRYIKLYTTHTGVIAHAEIAPTTGIITLMSLSGKNYNIPATEDIQLQGSWYYGG